LHYNSKSGMYLWRDCHCNISGDGWEHVNDE
jgi:hypothetical protein